MPIFQVQGQNTSITVDDELEKIELRAADTPQGTVEINASHAAMNGVNGQVVADAGGVRLLAGSVAIAVETGEVKQSIVDHLPASLEAGQGCLTVNEQSEDLKIRVRLSDGRYATATIALVVDT